MATILDCIALSAFVSPFCLESSLRYVCLKDKVSWKGPAFKDGKHFRNVYIVGHSVQGCLLRKFVTVWCRPGALVRPRLYLYGWWSEDSWTGSCSQMWPWREGTKRGGALNRGWACLEGFWDASWGLWHSAEIWGWRRGNGRYFSGNREQHK